MSTAVQAQAPVEKPQASMPEVMQKLLSRVYTLYYRKGNNPHSMIKNFYSTGKDMMESVTIAKRHCESIGARFVRLEPFLSDLRKDEQQHMGQVDQGVEG